MPKGPQKTIKREPEARLDPLNLLKLLTEIEKSYPKAKLDDEGKMGFIRIALAKVKLHRTFGKIRARTDYDTLRKAMKDYYSAQKAFCAST